MFLIAEGGSGATQRYPMGKGKSVLRCMGHLLDVRNVVLMEKTVKKLFGMNYSLQHAIGGDDI